MESLKQLTTSVIEDTFYKDAKSYWSEIPATLDGMLGGYGHISQIDIQGSRHLLKQIYSNKTPPEKCRALDCGAGIGRISQLLLMPFFDKVDLVEQNPAFLEQAKCLLKEDNPKLGNLYPVGLQEFQPEENRYDLIWIQWVLGHLTDSHLEKFLENCKKGLKPNGVIVVKENVTSSGKIEKDEQDSSMTRPYQLLVETFRKSGLQCCIKQKQTKFPKDLYSVYMFVLKPFNEVTT